MANNTVKEETADDFGKRIGECMAQGFLTMGLSIGSKLGLFDLMAGVEQPQTSQEIADAAGFKERYVREWLNLMVVGEIIDKDDTGYFLPHHRRERLAGQQQGNKVVLTWVIPIIAQAEQNLMDVFKLEGPKAVTVEYPGIHEWRNRLTLDTLDAMVAFLLKSPGLAQELENGIVMAELGCGTSQIILELARRYPRSTFLGFDIAEDALKISRATAKEMGLKNIQFESQDVCNLPDRYDEKFDWMYAKESIHDVPFPTKCLKGIISALKPGGKVSIVEVNVHSDSNLNKDNPLGTFNSLLSLYICLASSMGPEGGEGLGATWGKENALQVFQNIGFSSVEKVDEYELYYLCLCTK